MTATAPLGFASGLAHFGDRLALVGPDGGIDYRELDRRVDEVAELLLTEQFPEEVPVQGQGERRVDALRLGDAQESVAQGLAAGLERGAHHAGERLALDVDGARARARAAASRSCARACGCGPPPLASG